MELLIFLLTDDGVYYMYPDGSGVIPIQETRVQMVAETVEIRSLGDLRVEVRARFVLVNGSREAVHLTVGFPVPGLWGSEEKLPEEPEKLVDSLRFVSLVDGRRVKVRWHYQEGDTLLVALWGVDFKPGQRRELETRYTTSWNWGSNIDGFFYYGLRYITRTGATWAGPIESALITLELPREIPRPGVGLSEVAVWIPSPGGRLSADSSRITWRFSHWEPERDLSFEVEGIGYGFSLSFFTFVEELLKIPFPWSQRDIDALGRQQGLPPHLAARTAVNAIYALRGHRFKKQLWSFLEELAQEYDDTSGGLEESLHNALEMEREAKERLARIQAGPWGKYFPALYLGLHPAWYGFERLDSLYSSDPQWTRLLRAILPHLVSGTLPQDPQLRDLLLAIPWFTPGEGARNPNELRAVLERLEAR